MQGADMKQSNDQPDMQRADSIAESIFVANVKSSASDGANGQKMCCSSKQMGQ